MSISAATWINGLGLEPHPEGGYFRETYRATGLIPGQSLPPNFAGGDRPYGTAIYFLLKSGQFSALHRIQADEVWHFYAGSGLTVVVISPEGEISNLHLGADLSQGQQFQAWVAAGAWFGAYVNEPDRYSLVGCTVSPGFDFRDFEIGERDTLLAQFPQHRDRIIPLTHP